MNPRDRRLRLRKNTVRNLNPHSAAVVRGGTVHLDTKNPSENMACGTLKGPGCISYGCTTDQTGFTCVYYETCVTCNATECGTCDAANTCVSCYPECE